MTYNKLIDILRQVIYRMVDPMLLALARVGVTPNCITFLGLLLNIASATIFLLGYIGWGGAIVLFAGLFDMMDGRMARIIGLESRFGAIWDSTLDRYSEMFCLFGITFFFFINGDIISAIVTFVAMIGSVMVSYVRARAEGIGIKCIVGILQRTERVVLVAIGGILSGLLQNSLPLIIIIWIIAVFANFTAFQRLYYCWKELKQK